MSRGHGRVERQILEYLSRQSNASARNLAESFLRRGEPLTVARHETVRHALRTLEKEGLVLRTLAPRGAAKLWSLTSEAAPEPVKTRKSRGLFGRSSMSPYVRVQIIMLKQRLRTMAKEAKARRAKEPDAEPVA
jgi:DNA-binding PadR family transcriptional regulator